MKNKFKSVFVAIAMVFLVLAILPAIGQNPTMTINYNVTGLVPNPSSPPTVVVPIVLNGTNVGTWQFLFAYDPDVLTYVSETHNVNSTFPNIWLFTPAYVSPIDGKTYLKAALNYNSGSPGYTYVNQEVLTLSFTYNGGATNLSFFRPNAGSGNSDSYVKANPYNVLNTNTIWNNGSASGTYVSITSLQTGLWNSTSTWVGSKVPNNVNDAIIATGHIVTIDNYTIKTDSARCRNLTIQDGGALTVNSGKKLALKGNYQIGDGTTSAASFVDLGTTTVAGTTTVGRYMNGNWVYGSGNPYYLSHLVSSPVTNQSNSIFDWSLMNKWNEVTQYWDALSNPYITMGIGTGYAVSPKTPGITATFSGVLNTGTVSIGSLTKTGSSTWTGFNLIGNPFPCAIKWNTDITVSNVTNYAWYWNSTAYIALDRTIGTGVIPAEQGFFVQVSSGTGSVTIPSNANTRIHSTQAYFKSVINDLLTLKIEGNDFWDQTQIRILPESSDEYNNEFDALKFMGSDNAPQLFSYKQDVQLSINSVPTLSVYPIIQLGFKPGANGNFTITASDVESFAPSTEFYLEDLLSNKVQNLKTNQVYSFTASPGQQEHRFNLHFASVGVKENQTSGIQIYSAAKTIYVNIPSALTGYMVVYDLLGKEIARKQIESNALNTINLDVNQGYYLVKVFGNTAISSGKVFIR